MTERSGKYIVFEGIVGSGKTTQSKLLAERLKATWTREPGGSEIADAIREIVQGTEFGETMEPVCEAYLYAASRAQTLRAIVKPILDKGGTVVADRSVFTSLTYQAVARGLGMETILEINKIAVGDIWPDKVFYIDLPVEMALARTADTVGDKFEKFGPDFFYQGARRLFTTGRKIH